MGRKEVNMVIEDLFRILLDEEEVEIRRGNKALWYGKVKDMLNCYFSETVKLIYSLKDTYNAYIVIELND